MRTEYREYLADAPTIRRKVMQGTATLCSQPNFGRVCKALWPHKTAEAVAALVGCSVRSAAYQISGEQEPSLRCAQAVFNKMLERE